MFWVALGSVLAIAVIYSFAAWWGSHPDRFWQD